MTHKAKGILYSRDALRSLRKMPANASARIRFKFRQYATDPENLARNVKAPRGAPGSFRLRVGDWRVVFSEDRKVIAIIRIAPRSRAYD